MPSISSHLRNLLEAFHGGLKIEEEEKITSIKKRQHTSSIIEFISQGIPLAYKKQRRRRADVSPVLDQFKSEMRTYTAYWRSTKAYPLNPFIQDRTNWEEAVYARSVIYAEYTFLERRWLERWWRNRRWLWKKDIKKV